MVDVVCEEIRCVLIDRNSDFAQHLRCVSDGMHVNVLLPVLEMKR